jgi:hypothetical protein
MVSIESSKLVTLYVEDKRLDLREEEGPLELIELSTGAELWWKPEAEGDVRLLRRQYLLYPTAELRLVLLQVDIAIA